MRQRLYRVRLQWPKTRERSVRLRFRRWSLYVQALRRATSIRSLWQPLEAPSRAGSIYLGGTAQNEVAQSSAATLSAAYKTIAISGAVGYAVTLRLHSEVVGVWASGPVVPMLPGPMPNPSVNLTPCGSPRLAFISFWAKHGLPQGAGYLER